MFSRIPCVVIPGNHDNYFEDDKILLNSTLLEYNITNNKAFGFVYGDTYILPYDPYYTLYELEREEEDISLDKLKEQLVVAQ